MIDGPSGRRFAMSGGRQDVAYNAMRLYISFYTVWCGLASRSTECIRIPPIFSPYVTECGRSSSDFSVSGAVVTATDIPSKFSHDVWQFPVK